MKVVIDIPEEDYKTILNSKLPYAGEPPMSLVWVIRNGQVLPKGCGDLIDRDDLKLQMPTPIEDEYKTAYRIIDNAPTIIPADKGE